MVLREAPEAEEGEDHRNVRLLGKLAEEISRVGEHHAMARHDQRALRVVDQLSGKTHLPHVRGRCGLITAARDGLRVVEMALVDEKGLRDIDQDRAGSASRCEVEGLFDGRGDVLDAGHHVIVLGDRESDAGDVDLLEGVPADQRLDHLTGDGHERHRVKHRISETRHEIGRTGPAGRHADAGLPGGTGVAFSSEGGPLLEADEDMLETCSRQGIVEGDDCTARVAEDNLDPLLLQGAAGDLCTGQEFRFVARMMIRQCVRFGRCNIDRCHLLLHPAALADLLAPLPESSGTKKPPGACGRPIGQRGFHPFACVDLADPASLTRVAPQGELDKYEAVYQHVSCGHRRNHQ